MSWMGNVIVAISSILYFLRVLATPQRLLVGRRLPHDVNTILRFLKKRIPEIDSELTDFSGDNIRQRKFWVWISASFAHGDSLHLLNNMIMLMGYVDILEKMIGHFNVLFYFILCGAMGWMASYLHQRYLNHTLWEDAGQFVSTCGSSPATYGLAFLLASLCPNAPVANTWGLAPSLWVSLLCCVPVFFSGKYVEPWRGLVVLGVGHLLLNPWVKKVEAWMWLSVYLLRTFLTRLYDYLMLKQQISGTDNMSHLGGSLMGYVIAWTLLRQNELWSSHNCEEWELLQQWPDSMGDSLCRHRIALWGCFLFLIFRIVENF